ncbi:MAG: hypothetical protein ABJG41_03715 [Cyclobacteriaceae bacterium]
MSKVKDELVTIEVKGTDYSVAPGNYTAKAVREIGKIEDGNLLVEILPGGHLKKYRDDQNVNIKGGEQFDCQPLGGKSS